MSGNVVSMKPFIVTVPACVELLLITMEVRLVFGPFNSYEDGRQWAIRFEAKRTEIEAASDITIEGVFVADLTTAPFVDVHTYTCDVVEAGPDARKPDAVIPSGDPTLAATNVGIYAMRALYEAVSFGLAHLESEAEH